MNWLHQEINLRAFNRQWLFQRQAVSWRHYLFTALISYVLLWIAVFVEMLLTWRHQLHLISHYGYPSIAFPHLWLLMCIPATITFLILLPFVRFPILRRIAFVCICLGWTLFLLLTEAGVK